MGTKVGRDVCCLGKVTHEFEQVTIGDGAVINDNAFLLTHTVENRRVKIRPISIGARATVGSLCAVLPDAAMEEGSTLAPMSLVSPCVGVIMVVTCVCSVALTGLDTCCSQQLSSADAGMRRRSADKANNYTVWQGYMTNLIICLTGSLQGTGPCLNIVWAAKAA